MYLHVQVDVPSLLALLGVWTRGGPHCDTLRSGDLLYLDINIYNIYDMWISIYLQTISTADSGKPEDSEVKLCSPHQPSHQVHSL